MSPETRDFLETVRTAEDPTAEDERRVLAAVQAVVAASALAGAGLAASNAGKLAGGGVASGLKLGGLALGLGAAWLAVSAATAPPAPPPAAARATTTAARAQPARSGPSVLVVPSSSAARPAAPSPPGGVVRPAPSVPAAAPPAPAPPSLREEIALLAEVQAALERGDGATALRRLDGSGGADPRLLAERKAARVLALCLLGRTEEAERAARAFLRGHPKSVQRSALERSCAAKTTVEP
jgi:hypothetical protein